MDIRLQTVYLILFCSAFARCQNGDPCKSYMVLNDTSMTLSRSTLVNSFAVQRTDMWYRFTIQGKEGLLASSCPTGTQCGTAQQAWLSGNVPEYYENTTSVDICIKGKQCCERKRPIKVKNCNTYVVYKLIPLPQESNYCFNLSTEQIHPIATTVQTTTSPTTRVITQTQADKTSSTASTTTLQSTAKTTSEITTPVITTTTPTTATKTQVTQMKTPATTTMTPVATTVSPTTTTLASTILESTTPTKTPSASTMTSVAATMEPTTTTAKSVSTTMKTETTTKYPKTMLSAIMDRTKQKTVYTAMTNEQNIPKKATPGQIAELLSRIGFYFNIQIFVVCVKAASGSTFGFTKYGLYKHNSSDMVPKICKING